MGLSVIITLLWMTRIDTIYCLPMLPVKFCVVIPYMKTWGSRVCIAALRLTVQLTVRVFQKVLGAPPMDGGYLWSTPSAECFAVHPFHAATSVTSHDIAGTIECDMNIEGEATRGTHFLGLGVCNF